MARLSARSWLLPASLGLLIAAACGGGGDEGNDALNAPGVTGNSGYGQPLIGYKNAAAAQSADAVPNSGSAAMGDSDGGMEFEDYGSGGMAYSAMGGAASMMGGAPSVGGASGLGGATSVGGASTGGALSAVGGGVSSGIVENPFWATAQAPTSTFSIDADSGSYTLARASIRDGVLPDPEHVRVEEFLNYFHFHYAEPAEGRPLALYTELGACPWNPSRELLLLGVQGQEVAIEDQPPANLVYLLDVSGSMADANKLPLLKRGFRMLSRQLRPEDRVSIVTYAGSEAVVVDGVSGAEKAIIDDALAALQSGGSTNGQGGIQKAYELAQKHYIDGGTNRVLLATDGDFNVGLSDPDELATFIATKRETGVFLSVYGFGDAWSGGNFDDETAEKLADNGNGIYFYIDGDEEARRAFLHTISGSLITVAKDVKLQVAFNPDHVAGYRLIGYENRLLAESDFSNDAVDAGELGASMSVTALYEIVRAGTDEPLPEPLPGTVPELPEADDAESGSAAAEPEPEYPPLGSQDMVQVRLRYKDSDSDTSQLMVETRDRAMWRDESSAKFLFAAGVAELAMVLRGSQYLPSRDGGVLRGQLEAALPLDGEGAVREASALVKDAFELR